MNRAAILTLFLLLLVAGSAGADDTIAIRCGDYIRARTLSGDVFEGQLRFNDGDSLALRQRLAGRPAVDLGEQVRIHTLACNQLSAVIVQRRQTQTGLQVGALIGAAIGFLWGTLRGCDGHPTLSDVWTNREFLKRFFGATAICSALGAFFGHATVRWTPVSPGGIPQCGVDQHGVEVSLSLTL